MPGDLSQGYLPPLFYLSVFPISHLYTILPHKFHLQSASGNSVLQPLYPIAKSKRLSTKLFGLCSDGSIISYLRILNRYSLICVYFQSSCDIIPFYLPFPHSIKFFAPIVQMILRHFHKSMLF